MSVDSALVIVEKYKQAVWDRDAEALVGLYAEDARVFDLWERWAYESRAEWAKSVGEWFNSLDDNRVLVEFKEPVFSESAGLAAFHAFVVYASMDAQGKETRRMTNRMSWVFELKDKNWVIIHEHSSAPVGMETMKVSLTK
jgi:ketosteroid isomerase-like protein